MKAFVGVIVGMTLFIVILVLVASFWQTIVISSNIRRSADLIEHYQKERGITK